MSSKHVEAYDFIQLVKQNFDGIPTTCHVWKSEISLPYNLMDIRLASMNKDK